MLTVDYDRLDVRAGQRVLDLGCGEGRHSFEAYRRGATVVAVDLDHAALGTTREWLGAMDLAGEAPDGAHAGAIRADLLALPFPDASFDRVIASEVLEHIPADTAAIAELSRVLKPGGLAAVTVPRWFPERICWALSDEHHANEGGHVRIYKRDELRARLGDEGLSYLGGHHAHALHSPYWWLKCVSDDGAVTRLYHKLLVWDIVDRPWATRAAERLLNPLLGKSVVLYVRKGVA